MAEFDIQGAFGDLNKKMDQFISAQATHNENTTQRVSVVETQVAAIQSDMKDDKFWTNVKMTGAAIASALGLTGLRHIFKGL